MRELISVILKKKMYFILLFLFLFIGCILSFLNDKAFLIKFLDSIRNEFLNTFFIAITKLGEFYPFVFFFFFYLYKKSRKSFAIASLGLVMPLVSYYLKQYFKHPRPLTYFYKYLNDMPVKGIADFHYHTGHNSFPSGHTFAAFALFTFITLVDKKHQILYICIAILVAISRVYLIQHFLEDILFGSVLGAVLGIFIYYIFFILLKDKQFLDVKFNFLKKRS